MTRSDNVKNHVIGFYCPCEFFLAQLEKRAWAQSPFNALPALSKELKFFVNICGQEGYGDYYEKTKLYYRSRNTYDSERHI